MSLVAGTTILGKSASRLKNLRTFPSYDPSSNTWHLKDLNKYKNMCVTFFTTLNDCYLIGFLGRLFLGNWIRGVNFSKNLLVPLAGAKAQQTVTELELKFGSPTDHEVMRVMRVICGRLWEGNQFVNFDVFFNTKGFWSKKSIGNIFLGTTVIKE